MFNLKAAKECTGNMRDHSIIEKLQVVLNQIPISLRMNSALEYDLDEENLDKNLEAIYQAAVSRFKRIDYYFQWSQSLSQNPKMRPPLVNFLEMQGMLTQFNDLNNINDEDVSLLNRSFSRWINNLLLRELDEFLQYYLLDVYETCLIVDFVKKEISSKDISDAKCASDNFEKSSLKERIKILRKNYNIDLSHKAEVYSLNKIRQIFAHFDGVVQRKFCNQNGILEIAWPINSVKLKHRKTGKLVNLEDAPRPFNEDYGDIQITWLSNYKKTKYVVKDKIELSHVELNQLVFFYFYVLNELHDRLVQYIGKNGIKVRQFQKYSLTPTFCFLEE